MRREPLRIPLHGFVQVASASPSHHLWLLARMRLADLGSSTIAVSLLLGANCFASPGSCPTCDGYSLKGTSAAPPSIGAVPQVPGVPAVRLRPEHTRPVLQVPLFPVPQQGCPEAPQVVQESPLVASTQLSGEVQAVTPPSRTGPPVVAQQSCPFPPHV